MKFSCIECLQPYLKWQGFCGSCGNWNSIEESAALSLAKITSIDDLALSNIDISKNEKRILLCDESLNLFLGGGLAAGSLVLLYGEPGAGKSTLISGFKPREGAVFYISGEEHKGQVAKRFKRVSTSHDEVYILDIAEINLIKKCTAQLKPSFIIIDSIQTLVDDEGKECDVKNSIRTLSKMSRDFQIPIILIGHQTKSNTLAGPNYLKHMVDVVLELSLSSNKSIRILRATKNRYGGIEDKLLYRMNDKGLELVK